MTKLDIQAAERTSSEATIWIDHNQAVIVDRIGDVPETVDILMRGSFESEAAFERRAAAEIANDDRVVITGPAFARTEFERAYVALTHRPDRIVDVEPNAVTAPTPNTCRVY
jgi:hypothetical protein